MAKLFTVGLALILVGAGCSYKYQAKWNDQDQGTATTTPMACASEGQKPQGTQICCAGLSVIAFDDSFEACGKPGTGHKARVCAAPDEVLTAETPNCCAGLEPTEKNNKWVCDYQK